MTRFHNPKLAVVALLAVCLFLAAAFRSTAAIGPSLPASTQVAFGSDCEALLIREIQRARQEVLVAIYSITRRTIADALLAAKKRGATVQVKYDRKSSEWEGMEKTIRHLKAKGIVCIPVTFQNKEASMHHKFTVIDRKRVLTGSYNYTHPASELNCENIVLLDSTAVAQAFAVEFARIRGP